MTKAAFSSISSKSRGQVILEIILLVLCFCVIALRAMITESPGMQSTAMAGSPHDTAYSLSLSAVLICLFAVWFVIGFCRERFIYRRTGIEVGLCLFCIAAVITFFAASNKRAAITNSATLIAPILMAVLLVQLLDSHSKIKLLLAVIAALGIVQAYQCTEQYFVSNQMTIEQYEENREAVLGPLGIKSGTFAQFLFEHRLYTKGVRGFFTTSNSAGSFSMLATLAAAALIVDKIKNRKHDTSGPVRIIVCALGAVLVIYGFLITRSTGAIIAMLAVTAMLTSFLLYGDWIKKYKKYIFIVLLLLFIVGCGVIVTYGISHDRLPGGNSMLVRWQYWGGAAKIYADHPMIGIGGDNFGIFYTHYKTPSALETVSDPHNFVLSIITQYGPIGLIGFLAVFSIPLWKAASSHIVLPSGKTNKKKQVYTKLTMPVLIIISAVLLFIRPVLSPIQTAGSLEEKSAVIILLYVIPAVVFIAGFLLLTTARISDTKDYSNIASAVLFCTCIGFFIHNLIDFAIFEPGVFTAFCAVFASVIALDYHQKSRQEVVRKSKPFTKVLVAAAGIIMIWVYFNYALAPVGKAASNIKLAMQNVGYTNQFLDQAAKDDKLDPWALNLNGRFYLQEYSSAGKGQAVLLEKAAQCFLEATRRNKADFRNYEKLSQTYKLLGNNQKAYDSGLESVKRYPGSGRLQFNLAEIAENMGKAAIAIEHYKEAVIIEDMYRDQFREMYPGRELVSRIGEEKYERAKKQIQHLTQLPVK